MHFVRDDGVDGVEGVWGHTTTTLVGGACVECSCLDVCCICVFVCIPLSSVEIMC